ncbi:MAG: tripartite tricarboxylate transporter TctB family protein [Casimicrobiaceae bacterium]
MLEKLKGLLPYAALLLGAAYLYYNAGHFAYASRPGELGPDVWPRAILVLLMGVCAWEVLRRLLFGGTVAAQPAAQDAGEDSQEEPRHAHLLWGGIALTVLYVLGMSTLGFFLATVLYLALFMLVGRYRRFGVIAATSVIGSLAFVYTFMKIVYVSLPLGVGPFKQLSILILAALGIH